MLVERVRALQILRERFVEHCRSSQGEEMKMFMERHGRREGKVVE